MSGPTYMLAAKQSAYHDSCLPKTKATQPAATSTKNHTEGDYRGCDGVTQNKIWTESVESEKRCRKNWSHDWGYLTDYDAKGNLKQKEEMPEKVALYSESVPNTNSAMYGNRINTDLGQRMQAMEFKFYAEKRRRKMGNDLICY